jgi:hypothetical protein
VTPDRRLVATYRFGGKLQVARGAPGRRWTKPRAVRAGSGHVDLSRLAFAPNGDALLTVLTTARDTTHRLYAAWARRGRGFGRLRLVDRTSTELTVQGASLDRRGRATIVWQSGEHDIHVRRARFGGRFRRAWDTVRAQRAFYVEAEPAPAGGAVITWQETPEEFGTNTIRAAFVGAGPAREQLVASTGESRTTFYSPRLHTAAGHVALAWVQNHFAARGGRERAELHAAVLRP